MAKQANQTIIVKARCLLTQSKLPRLFWAEAIKTATQFSNLTPSNTRNMQIHYQTWSGQSVLWDIL